MVLTFRSGSIGSLIFSRSPPMAVTRGKTHGQIEAVPRLRSHEQSKGRCLPVVWNEQTRAEIPPAPPAHRALGTRYPSVRGYQCPRYYGRGGRQASLRAHCLSQLPGDEFRTVGEDIAAFLRALGLSKNNHTGRAVLFHGRGATAARAMRLDNNGAGRAGRSVAHGSLPRTWIGA